MLLIGCMICTPISRPIKGTETNALLKNNEQPRIILASFDLQANLFMKHQDSTSTKLNILGVKQQVNEVKKVNFHVHFKKSLLKRPKTFEQKCISNMLQQLTAARLPDFRLFLVGNSNDIYYSSAQVKSVQCVGKKLKFQPKYLVKLSPIFAKES